MIKLIQFVLLLAVVSGVIYALEMISSSNISPQQMLEHKTEQVVSMAQKIVEDAGAKISDKVEDDLHDISEQVTKEIK